MSLWRRQAFERFPEFRTKLQEAKSPMRYWIDLQFAFNEAYRKGDVELFKRILDYADWCFHAPRGKAAGDDLPTCIFVCLFEHMPQISTEEPVDRVEIGRSLLSWGGPTISHPHVKALYQNLIARRNAETKQRVKNS
jgi:hypothetical protein